MSKRIRTLVAAAAVLIGSFVIGIPMAGPATAADSDCPVNDVCFWHVHNTAGEPQINIRAQAILDAGGRLDLSEGGEFQVIADSGYNRTTRNVCTYNHDASQQLDKLIQHAPGRDLRNDIIDQVGFC